MIDVDRECGVYAIRCIPTGELYIGGTQVPFRCRFMRHQSALRTKRSGCKRLQERYDQYGEDAFEYLPLKAFLWYQVKEKEADAIAKLQPALNIYDNREAQLARDTGLKRETIRQRIKSGWSEDELTLPPHGRALHGEVNGEMLPARKIADMTGLSIEVIRARIKRGRKDAALLAAKNTKHG